MSSHLLLDENLSERLLTALQTLQEARELVDSAYNLRADVLRELLQRCTSVKTVRLCLQLGREGSLPWTTKLDTARLLTQVAPLVFVDDIHVVRQRRGFEWHFAS